MNYNNIIELLNKVSVRTSIIIDDLPENYGSGTIVYDNNNYYVITAEHCIYGDEENRERYSVVKPENIIVEYKENENFRTIKVLNIQSDRVKDYAVLKIENPEANFDFVNDMERAEQLIEEEKYSFLSFPETLKGVSKYFPLLPQSENYWHLSHDSWMNYKKSGSDVACGISGSGIFFNRYGKLYLVGLVTELRDEKGVFDDLKMTRIEELNSCFSTPASTFFNYDLYSQWEKQLKKKQPENLVKELQNMNSEFYKNLNRKLNVIYEDEAIEKIGGYVQDYLRGFPIMKQIESKSKHLFEELASCCEQYIEIVKKSFRVNVKDAYDAESKLLQMNNMFRTKVENIFEQDKNDLMLDAYVSYKIANFLMDCSINFKYKEDDKH